MDAYCQRQGLANNQCRFIFDGERIKDDDSPDSLEMENGDEIDVMVEQTGGAPSSNPSTLSCPLHPKVSVWKAIQNVSPQQEFT